MPTDFDLREINSQFAELNPIQRIATAQELFAGNIVLSTTFGPTAPVMLRLVTGVAPDIPVINIRHWHETDRTKDLAGHYTERLQLNLKIYDAPKLLIPEDGTPEFAEFQRRIKVEPFQQMLDDLQPTAYFSGAMSWQTAERRDMAFVEHRGSVLVVNPILDLTKEDVDIFFELTGLPRNNDYFDPAKGVTQKIECRLNTTDYR